MAGSARGLFRATGKKSSHLVKVADGYERRTEIPRETNDFYPTPRDVTRALLSVEGDRLLQFGSVWENAAGDGTMAEEMRNFGLDVYMTDLIDRGCGAKIENFFDVDFAPSKAVVTNPPYSEVNARDGNGRWLTHSMDLGCKYVALFLNWGWPAAKGLAPILAKHPISRVYLCRWKVDFTGEGAPPMHNAWFVWDEAHTGETVLRFLDRRDPRQGVLFGD